MKKSRIQGPFVALALLVAQSALAQDTPAFVRRSTQPTPTVTDVEVLRQQRIEVPSLAILSDPQRSAVLQLDLFADISFRAVRDRLEPTRHGISWVGKLEGYPESDAIFVVVEDELIGHIWTTFGFFRIERQSDGTYLAQQVNPGTFPEGDDVVELPPESDARQVLRPSSVDDGSVVDLIVVYTRDALTGFGNETRARAAIDVNVAETNQALRNTGVNTRVRLLQATMVEYQESGDSGLDLQRLSTANDGFLDDVLSLRDLHQADLVALVPERLNIGGRAYLGSMSGRGESGFSVTRRHNFLAAFQAMAFGRTFTHELGHNFGAQHDWYSTASPGAHAYSRGYVSLAGRFST